MERISNLPFAFCRAAANSNRSCETCSRSIQPAELCLTQIGHHTRWRHLRCARIPPAVAAAGPEVRLPGAASLDEKGQAAVRKWLSGEKPTEAEAAGTVLLYDDANKKPRRQTRIGPSFEPWPAFSVDEKPFTNRSERTVKMEHSRGLLTRLQHEVYAQRHTEAMRLVSLLSSRV